MADIYFVRDSLAVFGGSGRQAKPRPAGNIGQNFGRLGEDESKQERNLPRQGRTTGIPRISTGSQNSRRVSKQFEKYVKQWGHLYLIFVRCGAIFIRKRRVNIL